VGAGAGVVVIILITGLAVPCGRTFVIAVAVVQPSTSRRMITAETMSREENFRDAGGHVIEQFLFERIGVKYHKYCDAVLPGFA
jgi:hypothetical protein